MEVLVNSGYWCNSELIALNLRLEVLKFFYSLKIRVLFTVGVKYILMVRNLSAYQLSSAQQTLSGRGSACTQKVIIGSQSELKPSQALPDDLHCEKPRVIMVL